MTRGRGVRRRGESKKITGNEMLTVIAIVLDFVRRMQTLFTREIFLLFVAPRTSSSDACVSGLGEMRRMAVSPGNMFCSSPDGSLNFHTVLR